jgi:hypothetical protein
MVLQVLIEKNIKFAKILSLEKDDKREGKGMVSILLSGSLKQLDEDDDENKDVILTAKE